jgi:hypothetical protein
VIISRSPLKALKQDLVIHNLSQEISLERLEQAMSPNTWPSNSPRDFPSGFAKVVYRHSGGNALFMVTILQDMVKKGLIARSGDRWRLTVPLENVDPSVPETLDQLIEAQFQQLSEIEQRILRSASVAGERFSVWAVSSAAEIEPATVEDACERLVERLQFMVRRSRVAQRRVLGALRACALLCRPIASGSEVSRSKLHRILAQTPRLSATSELELANELALHFEGGRDYEQAMRYLILSAENASRRFSDCILIEGRSTSAERKLALVLELD